MDLDSQKGTYVLIFQANKEFVCKVGKGNNFEGNSGSYVYVGSAFGPGGVRARIIHHLKMSSKPHWHLDYIRPYIQPIAVCYCYSSNLQEHRWATVVSKIAGVQFPMYKFGSTDCSCPSHLFYFQRVPMTGILQRKLRNGMPDSLKLHNMKITAQNIKNIIS